MQLQQRHAGYYDNRSKNTDVSPAAPRACVAVTKHATTTDESCNYNNDMQDTTTTVVHHVSE